MSRHRGAKRLRRYGLLGVISLLSLAYLWSVEREPFHTVLPGHYGRLSSLLDLLVLQSGRLLPLHSAADFRPAWVYLRALSLLFRKPSPQWNYPLATVPLFSCKSRDPLFPKKEVDFKLAFTRWFARLERWKRKGGISLMPLPPHYWGSVKQLPPILHNPFLPSATSYSKGA